MDNLVNPFAKKVRIDDDEDGLISRALGGNRDALEMLIRRHQPWIYNIALRMVYDPFAAEDMTQEVLIKLVTRLGSFDPSKSAFRTWLYRIVANHVINAKRSKSESVMDNALRGKDLETFMERLPDGRRHGAERYSEEVRVACVQCILLRLKRRERMIFILGALFNVTDAVGGEICGVSRANFRKILSRSRSRLYLFFRKNCGLLDERNPCRCSHCLDPLIRSGLIDPGNLVTARKAHGTIQDAVAGAWGRMDGAYGEFIDLFRSQPFLTPPDRVAWLRDLFEREEFKELFQIA